MRRKTKSTLPLIRKIDALCRIDRFGDAIRRLDGVDLLALRPIDIEAALKIDLECCRALGIRFVVTRRWAQALAAASAFAPEIDFGACLAHRLASESVHLGDFETARALVGWALAAPGTTPTLRAMLIGLVVEEWPAAERPPAQARWFSWLSGWAARVGQRLDAARPFWDEAGRIHRAVGQMAAAPGA